MIPHSILITPKEWMLVVVALWNIIRWITLEVEFRSNGQSWPLGKGEVIKIGKFSGFFFFFCRNLMQKIPKDAHCL